MFAHKPNTNHGTDVLVDLDGDWTFSGSLDRFRPLKTAEQTAAEERSSAIESMRAEINWQPPQLGSCPVAALYDAGYRKQEES